MTNNSSCDSIKLPRECQCQRTHRSSMLPLNETRVRCRQLTELKRSYDWSSIFYDRLVFDNSNENLTLDQFILSNIVVRTLRINIQNLFLNDYVFNNGYIGELIIFSQDNYGQMNFLANGQTFSGATITNLYLKSIDFQRKISETIFSNVKLYKLFIHSSKFYGFTNSKFKTTSKLLRTKTFENFLEYDLFVLKPMKTLNTHISSSIQSQHLFHVRIYTIISSIKTMNLTEEYFPNNIDFNEIEEIELNSNFIQHLHSHAFRHLKQFQGNLFLTNNKIETIHSYAFSDLNFLKNLSLANNLIENLTSKHFQNLKQLYELDLSSNKIKKLHSYTFQYLTNINTIHLNNNPLEYIHPNTFFNLTKLKQIFFYDVQFIKSINPNNFQWIWNLNIIHLVKTDFDLTDVAFCILSRYNQTLSHFSHQYSCSCNIHYFKRNELLTHDHTNSVSLTNKIYLRLSPICKQNENSSIFDENINDNDFIIHGLEEKCYYKLMFLDCDVMTTTTTTTTTMTSTIDSTNSIITREETIDSSNYVDVTSIETLISTRKSLPIKGTMLKVDGNNMQKLFTVIGILTAITIVSIMFVFFWYYFKNFFNENNKKTNFNEKEDINNENMIKKTSSSSNILEKLDTLQIPISRNQSVVAFAPPTILTPSMIKKKEIIYNEPIDSFIDDESIKNQMQDSES